MSKTQDPLPKKSPEEIVKSLKWPIYGTAIALGLLLILEVIRILQLRNLL